MKYFGKFILWIFGWKFEGFPQKEMKNCVFIEAPHTSMWDFVFGRCGLWILGVNAHFFIKREMFFFPLGFFLKALGGVPVNRKKGLNSIDIAVDKLKNNKDFSIIITPEGTRKYTENWKKGFYVIAQKANVPIYLSFLNYKKKIASSGELFFPTGDYEKDLAYIQNFYRDKEAKYPENFNMSKLYQK
ncbi:MAG: 1-acyl-sn-glycerol-3-phosphate acyltransferase [Bacteroidales bacterium]|jgi:1-acyl-sn-glycerol-3-phosphate acyltransferase|nr:1-acyl-sn-glycerol-3-phosphate acyltransferase [Bacteroidales bacterium]